MQSIYLDTAIASILVILLFSVVTYSIQEWLASVRQLRGKMLEKSVFEALNDKLNKSYGVLLYEHPQVDLLKKDQNSIPAYMPSSNFAIALIDLVAKECTSVAYRVNENTQLLEEEISRFSDDPFENYKAGLQSLKYSDQKVLLESFLMGARNYTDLQNTIEIWFNQYMDRVSGWYRKQTSVKIGFISVLLVLAFNFDALFLVQQIYNNATLRNNLVATAQVTANTPIAQQKITEQIAAINQLNLPIGWKYDQSGFHLPDTFCTPERPWWSILIGWSLAAILISFGAPFWFNLLIKLVPLRRAGVKPAAESSKK